MDGNWHSQLKRCIPKGEFGTETLHLSKHLSRVQQPRPKRPMHLDGRANNVRGNLVRMQIEYFSARLSL